MKTLTSNRVNMIRTTLTFLDANAPVTATIPAFAGIKTTADNKLILIDQLTQIAYGTTHGVTLDTKIIRTTMSNLALKCGDAVSAYAASVNNNTLRLKVTYTLPALNRLKKEEVDDICQTIHDEANTHIADAGAFGYDAANVTDLQTAISLYRASTQNPRHAIISRSEAKINIDLLVREIIDNLFVKQLDKMVNTLKLTNIEFVNNYFRSREIIDLGSTTAKVRGTIKNPEAMPLVGVKFTIRITGQLEKVDETLSVTGGKYGISKLLPNNYDLVWQFPGYQTLTETNLRIAAGKEIRRNITLQPLTAQTVTIQGFVRNHSNNFPVAGANITVGNHTTLSQIDGSYIIQFLPTTGSYNISINASGFQPVNGTINVQPGQTINNDINLTPAAGNLSGQVTASDTNMPIPTASIELTPGNHTTNADPAGFFTMNNIPAGNYTLTASAPGYASNQNLITISPNANTNSNIALDHNP